MNQRGPSSRTDFELLDAWREGDEGAGALLFERYYSGVARFFLTKIDSDYEDLVQATFLGCLESLEHFRGDASFRTLLYAIARNKLLQRLRKNFRDQKYTRRWPSSVLLRSDAPSSGTLLRVRNQRECLLIGLRALPLDTQVILELFYWEGLSVREVAAVVGVGVNTVKTRMRRGRQQLVLELEKALELRRIVPLEHSELDRNSFERWAQEVRGCASASDGPSREEVPSWS